MTLLRPAQRTAGFLKAGFQGFQGAGKTYTATELALATRAHFGLQGPIAFFDTESGSDYVAARVREQTGADLLVAKSRSLDDLITTVGECAGAGVAVLLVDSVTHLWRNLCEGYLEEVNAALKRRRRTPRTKLEFQDWGVIKARWNRWTDVFLNADLHIVICGRAGYTYDFETSDSGKRELIKTGTKMRAEGEFGFEPSLLIEMEQVQVDRERGKPRVTLHRATCLKDRFGVLQGKQCDFKPGSGTGTPVWTFLRGHVERLSPDAHTEIDTESRPAFGVSEDGDAEWAKERRLREILAEEIKGELTTAYPSQGADDKAAKLLLMDRHFNTRSWTRIEKSTSSAQLEAGLLSLRRELRPDDFPAPAIDQDDDVPDFGGEAA